MISVITPSIRPQYLNITQECLEAQTFQDFEWLVEIGLRHRGFMLPTDMNKMLRRAKGDRVVMLQDCIHILPNALEKIASMPNEFTTFPVGKVKELGQEPQWDWRASRTGKIHPHEWEADLASAPTQAFFDIGGYDEEFNKGWSWDNVEVGWRAQAAGYTFRCDNTVRGIAIDHDALTPNPFRNKLENNDRRANETRIKAEHGIYKLGYIPTHQ